MSYGRARAASSAAVPSFSSSTVEALAPQHERDDVEHARIVVGDEDARLRAHAAGTSSRTRARSSTIRTRVPSPGRRVELDLPAEAAHRLPHDREPEAEALGVAILAAEEAVEDVLLRLRAHADTGVLDLHAHRCTRPRTPRRTIRPASVCFAAFSPRFRSACSSRSRLTSPASSGGQSISTATPSIGRISSATSCRSACSDTASTRGRSWPACARASVSSARASRASRSASRSMCARKRSRSTGRPSRRPAAPRPRR